MVCKYSWVIYNTFQYILFTCFLSRPLVLFTPYPSSWKVMENFVLVLPSFGNVKHGRLACTCKNHVDTDCAGITHYELLFELLYGKDMMVVSCICV